MKTFAQRADELADWRYAPIEAICRAGVRSTAAAAILTCLGFEQVANLNRGMLAWNDCGLPVKADTRAVRSDAVRTRPLQLTSSLRLVPFHPESG